MSIGCHCPEIMCFSNVLSAAWQVWGLNNSQRCLAQGYWNALFQNHLILEHVATRGQNVRHLRYTPAGSVGRVSDARNTTQSARRLHLRSGSVGAIGSGC
jgi:hypothetical protein